MLEYRQYLIFVTLWLAIEIFFSWLATCHPIYQPQLANYAYQERCDLFIGPMSLFLKWFAQFWNSNRIIAAFTAVLAISTIGLWKQTARAAKVAEKAIEMSESGTLTVINWKIDNWNLPQPTIKFDLYNGGKNTIAIQELVFRAPVALDLPDVPNYDLDNTTSAPSLIAAGKRQTIIAERNILDAQRTAIESGIVNFYTYGRVRFNTPPFETIWELGFAQQVTWNKGVPRFSYPTNPGFNFLKRIA